MSICFNIIKYDPFVLFQLAKPKSKSINSHIHNEMFHEINIIARKNVLCNFYKDMRNLAALLKFKLYFTTITVFVSKDKRELLADFCV